jgi:hypothetical protein
MGDHTQGRPEWMSLDTYTGEPVPDSTGKREIMTDTTNARKLTDDEIGALFDAANEAAQDDAGSMFHSWSALVELNSLGLRTFRDFARAIEAKVRSALAVQQETAPSSNANAAGRARSEDTVKSGDAGSTPVGATSALVAESAMDKAMGLDPFHNRLHARDGWDAEVREMSALAVQQGGEAKEADEKCRAGGHLLTVCSLCGYDQRDAPSSLPVQQGDTERLDWLGARERYINHYFGFAAGSGSGWTISVGPAADGEYYEGADLRSAIDAARQHSSPSRAETEPNG